MFLMELTTESGALYTVNVISQKIKRTTPEDKDPPTWQKYTELQGGQEGEPLVIIWEKDADGLFMQTTTNKITKVVFPEVDV